MRRAYGIGLLLALFVLTLGFASAPLIIADGGDAITAPPDVIFADGGDVVPDPAEREKGEGSVLADGGDLIPDPTATDQTIIV